MVKRSNSKQIEVKSWGCIYATQQHLCLCGSPSTYYSRRTTTFNSCVFNSYCFSFPSSNTKTSSNPVTKCAHATSSCIFTLFHVTSSCKILWIASIPYTLFYSLIIYTNAPSNTSQHLRKFATKQQEWGGLLSMLLPFSFSFYSVFL